jgi:hypothetical protein
MSATPTPSKPLWFVVTSCVLGVSAPLTTAIHGAFAKSRELEIAHIAKSRELEIAEVAKKREIELAQQEQLFKTTSWFLETAVDQDKTPELRQQVLRFISSPPGESRLTAWAIEELKRVDDLVELRRLVAVNEQERESATRKISRLQAIVGQKAAEAEARAAELAAATAAKTRAEAEAEKLRKDLAAKGAPVLGWGTVFVVKDKSGAFRLKDSTAPTEDPK